MQEAREEIKFFRVRRFHACTEGAEFLPTGITLLSNPAKYEHRCTGCGEINHFLKRYPALEEEKVNLDLVP